jgi:hypothetical protein
VIQDTDVAASAVLAGLRAALDPDAQQAEQKYALLRRRLVSFFEWNTASAADKCADETLTTCAWKLTDGAPAENVPASCLLIARAILLRDQQQPLTPQASPTPPPTAPEPQAPETPAQPPEPPAAQTLQTHGPQPADLLWQQVADQVAGVPTDAAVPVATQPAPEPEPFGDLQGLLHAFEKGLDEMPEDNRDLILAYYAGEHPQAREARHAVARRLRIPHSQLRYRAHKTRAELEHAVMDRAQRSAGGAR